MTAWAWPRSTSPHDLRHDRPVVLWLEAMSPFGNLFAMPVYLADSLMEDEEIAFNAGSHTQLVKMAFRDFGRLVQPEVMRFGVNA